MYLFHTTKEEFAMIKNLIVKLIQNSRKKHLKESGSNVSIRKKCNFQGNIYCGSNITIGRGCSFVSTVAGIYIHDNVVFGPEVVIYSGDHQMNMISPCVVWSGTPRKVNPRKANDSLRNIYAERR